MSVFNKLFGKKEPAERQFDLGLPKEPNLGLDLGETPYESASSMPAMSPYPGMQQMPSSRPAQPDFESQRQFSQPQQSSVEKDIQILNAKLDSLKAILDSINQRLANIERIANESQKYEKY